MSKQKAAGRATAAVLDAADRPEKIRNIALVGHSGAGKTTLVERLLTVTGTIARAGSVAEGTTVSDHDRVEVAQQRSVALSVCPLRWDGMVVNLLDTPGYPDFTGELRAGLRAADGALFVVSASEDIDSVTVSLWQECAALNTPRAVVITKLDAPRADYAATLAACRRLFGADAGHEVLPLYVLDGSALIGLLTLVRRDYAGGFPPVASPAAVETIEAEAPRVELIEAIIDNSEDDTLLEQYLNGTEIGLEVLIDDLETAVARGHFHPVLPACSATELGLAELLELLCGGFPSPAEVDVPASMGLYGTDAPPDACSPEAPLLAEVVRTSVDPYLGRLCVLRVFAGTLTAETAVHVSGHGGAARGHPDHDTDQRIGPLFSPLGASLRPVERVVAGDICAVARLEAETGDTISAKSAPLLMAPWDMPEPLLPVAVQAATNHDEDALAKALGRLTASDPSVRVERDAGTGQLVLWCLGEAHADVVLDRLRSTGAHVEAVELRIALRSTFRAEARGHGRLVKQSGGHGQFAVCDVVVTPLERGAGVRFANKVAGGSVPAAFVSAVEKGVRAQLALGLDHDGTPVVDVLVALVDGKAHSVDSSDAAFQTAAALAVKDAAAGGLALLEPVARVQIIVPDAHVGAVLADLSGRRAHVTGTESDPNSPRGTEQTLVHAEIPDAELARYPTTLRSLTAGSGRFTRTPARYDLVPEAVANRLRPATG